jgi:hypothetical protein
MGKLQKDKNVIQKKAYEFELTIIDFISRRALRATEKKNTLSDLCVSSEAGERQNKYLSQSKPA